MTHPQLAARTLFLEMTDTEPEGVWSAPGRVNLIGEHTDYNEGFVLPFAIQQRTYAAASLRNDDRIRVVSAFSDEVVEVSLTDLQALFPSATSTVQHRVPEWSAYVLGVAWALLELQEQREAESPRGSLDPREHVEAVTLRGVDIAIASDVPVGAGLSSSAALESATASALNELWRTDFNPRELAQAGRRAENEAVGAPTGIMDQMASMLGEPDAATFIDCRSLQTTSVVTGFAEADLELLVIDTRVQHSHSNGGYRERRDACERGAALLGFTSLRDASEGDLERAAVLMDDVTFRRVRHVITENQRVLDTVEALGSRGPRAIGELLVASHASMRDDFEISVPELDLAVDTALAFGAIGARMTGGGFGGAAIALIEHTLVDSATAAVREAFQAAGFTDPHVFTVRPSEGPRRESW